METLKRGTPKKKREGEKLLTESLTDLSISSSKISPLSLPMLVPLLHPPRPPLLRSSFPSLPLVFFQNQLPVIVLLLSPSTLAADMFIWVKICGGCNLLGWWPEGDMQAMGVVGWWPEGVGFGAKKWSSHGKK